MKPVASIAALSLLWAAPAAAQPMPPSMPGMTMPMAKPAPKPMPRAAGPTKKRPAPSVSHEMSAMPDMAMPPAAGGDHAAHDLPGMATPTPPANAPAAATPGMSMPSASDAMSGPPAVAEVQTPPPPVPTDHAADRAFDPAVMSAARAQLRLEHGGGRYSKVMANLAEYQARPGGGYRWEGEAWYGGDLDRVVVKSEGEGARRGGLESAEVQALYSRAIGPYFDLQAGVRQDIEPRPRRTYATVGVEGLLPYWFAVQGALFLSNKGGLLGRAEGTYDLRLTQRLVLQPRAELNFAAQDAPEIGVGSGLTKAELGLRLRYEIRREFAPYIGVSYDRRYGRTADFARAAGDDAGGASFVVGIRAWF